MHTPAETTTQESKDEENTNDENDTMKEEAVKEEAVQVTAPKPSKPKRSMSEMGPQQAKASDGLRKHSLDQVSGSAADEAQHEKEARAPTSQKADNKGYQETSEDEKMEELLRRCQRHRSILDEIIEQEDARDKEGKSLCSN